jgi:hypothetical protein
MDKKDYVAQIMDEWYESMATNNVSVQPKASTLLGMVLANYEFKPNYEPRNLWDEFLTIPGGRFASWYDSLSEVQKKEFDDQRKKTATDRNQTVEKIAKALLKG